MDLDKFTDAEYSPRTVISYQRDWGVFQAWCQAAGRDSLPATPHTVQLYATDLICHRGRKVDTLKRHAVSIQHIHRKAGHPSPCGADMRKLLAGAQRILCQKPEQKAAITIPQLRSIVESTGADTPITARNCAVLVFGLASALRRSNLASLRLEDMDFANGEAITVHVRQEKQDRTGEGRYLTVPIGRHQASCPVRAVKQWMRFRGDRPGPLFQTCHRGHVTGKSILGNRINQIVKESVARIGLDQSLYGAHSLRASFVTAAILAKVSDFDIALHTGHRDMRMLRLYYRPADPRRPSAAATIGL